ncbi:MAG TPA: VOC family protein [Steroidobacteraceae bacterium]|nr:VOC family protein [Steroidobacteraceae bacterium]
MSSKPKPVPEGYQSVIPYFAIAEPGALLEFLVAAFGAEPGLAMRSPDGALQHAEAKIGNCVLMMGRSPSGRPNTTYMYVPDVDAVYRRAMTAPGAARSLREPTDEWYGDRSAGVEDSQGNQWWLATHIEDLSPEELAARAKKARSGG